MYRCYKGKKKPQNIGLTKPLMEGEHLFWVAGKGFPEEVEFKLRADRCKRPVIGRVGDGVF